MRSFVGFWSGELSLLEVTARSLETSSLGEDSRVLDARRSTEVPESRQMSVKCAQFD